VRCVKNTDVLVYIRKNLYFCKTRFRKQYNKEKMVLTMKTKIMAAVLLVALIFAWQPAQAKDEHEDDGDKHELITIKYIAMDIVANIYRT